MANKYHFNKETGRANICRAANNCPLGANTPHFDNKTDAKKYVEKEAKESNDSFNSLSKKKSNINTFDVASIKKGDVSLQDLKNMRNTLIESSENFLKNPKDYEKAVGSENFASVLKTTKESLDMVNEEIEKREKNSQTLNNFSENIPYQVKSGALNSLNKKSNKNEDESIYNNEKIIEKHRDIALANTHIQDYDKKHKSELRSETHYSLYAGKLNPSRSIGSGSEYFTPGEQSLVVLSEGNGKGARVISSYGDYYENPEAELGKPVVQAKQQSNGGDTYHDLNVVGYVSNDGKAYGYIPDKQVSFFVYK